MPDLGPQPSTEPESEAQPVAGREPASDTTAVESEPHEPPTERERPSPFDAIWPPRDRAAKPRLAEAGAEDTRAPQETDAPQATEDAVGPESSITPEVEPGAPWQTADAAAAEGTETATTEAIPYEPQPVSILKSGVVDGMAYTLYSDGSIEAQLPDETIRFASIAELRLHLEKTG
jgi:hypothetical protein